MISARSDSQNSAFLETNHRGLAKKHEGGELEMELLKVRDFEDHDPWKVYYHRMTSTNYFVGAQCQKLFLPRSLMERPFLPVIKLLESVTHA